MRVPYTFLFGLFLVVSNLSAESTEGATKVRTGDADDCNDIELPKHLKPTKYVIKITPNLDTSIADGYVEINMVCSQPGSDKVTLHAASDVTIDADSVKIFKKEDNATLEDKNYLFNGIIERELMYQFVKFQMTEDLEEGSEYVIRMRFQFNLDDKLDGFYLSSYKNQETGEKRNLAVTQFEATSARKSFPCFDEPEYKAVFEISLGRKPEMSSLSNMPLKEDGEGVEHTDLPGYVWDHFEPSVPMSTYLVAFVVSDFGFLESVDAENSVRMRIWARKEALDQAQYAMDIGMKMLNFFENYFGVDYPLPKQDMIAIPDFRAGAMENWGLITYREAYLLYKPGVSSDRSKRTIAKIVSHELAHQWFGNLVSPKWWSHLWLNEGFASYVQYLGVAATQPEMNIMDEFVSKNVQYVFNVDSLRSSHKINKEVKTNHDIDQIFDAISYKKGASIIRMMDSFLTSNVLQKGLTNYLIALRYDSATQDDLWHHLNVVGQEENRLPPGSTVKSIMDTWTLQPGYPVVTVSRNYEDETLTSCKLTQKRFLFTLSDSNEVVMNELGFNYDNVGEEKWWIPLNLMVPYSNVSKDSTQAKFWMKPSQTEIEAHKLPGADQPVIFNVEQTGFYRVNYDERNWKMLIKQIQEDPNSVPFINRAQIIDDAMNLAKAGMLSYDIALSTTLYLESETSHRVWKAAYRAFNYIRSMLKRSGAYIDLKEYLTKLIKPSYSRITSHNVEKFKKNSSEDEKHYMRQVIEAACSVLEIEECINKMKQDFNSFKTCLSYGKDVGYCNEIIDNDLKRSTYCNVVRHGGLDEWEWVLKEYKTSNIATEKRSLLSALSCTKDISLLSQLLEWSIQGSESAGQIRKQDGTSIINAVSANDYGRDLAFDFIRLHWDKIVKTLGDSSKKGLSRILGGRNTKIGLQEIEEFGLKHFKSLGSGQSSYEHHLEKTRMNIWWMENSRESVVQWIKRENEKDTIPPRALRSS